MKEAGGIRQSGYAEWPHPDKGHDRAVLVEQTDSYGVFDGASNALASNAAAKIFKRESERSDPPSLEDTFQKIQSSTRRRHPFFVAQTTREIVKNRPAHDTTPRALGHALKLHRVIGLTTGTAVRFLSPTEESPPMLDYVYSGDSPLYILDRTQDELIELTDGASEDASDASSFLGSATHQLESGRLPLPDFATIALLTDGATGPSYAKPKINERIYACLSGSADPSEKASSLVKASMVNDDATAIVIEHRA